MKNALNSSNESAKKPQFKNMFLFLCSPKSKFFKCFFNVHFQIMFHLEEKFRVSNTQKDEILNKKRFIISLGSIEQIQYSFCIEI